MGGYSRGQTGIKDTYPAQGHIEEHRRNTDVPRQQGHRAEETAPHRGIGLHKDGVAADIFGLTARWAIRAKEMQLKQE